MEPWRNAIDTYSVSKPFSSPHLHWRPTDPVTQPVPCNGDSYIVTDRDGNKYAACSHRYAPNVPLPGPQPER